jgi:hypothetical protein
VCRDVIALEPQLPAPRRPLGADIKDDLAKIGISIRPTLVDFGELFGRLGDPAEHVGIVIGFPIGKDLPTASSIVPPMFQSDAIGVFNWSLVGSTNEQLAKWGYPARNVPNVDRRIDQCLSVVGEPQTECWATLDQYLMEEVATLVPLVVDIHIQIIPKRIVAYSFDQFTTLPALDRIAVSR